MPLVIAAPVVQRVFRFPSIAFVGGEPPCDADAEGVHDVRESAVSVPPSLEPPLELLPLELLELLLLEPLLELLEPLELLPPPGE
jgi:hypothetical protein